MLIFYLIIPGDNRMLRYIDHTVLLDAGSGVRWRLVRIVHTWSEMSPVQKQHNLGYSLSLRVDHAFFLYNPIILPPLKFDIFSISSKYFYY